jgi:DNA helicase II / ATP-dependent DNA helicase PcrA
MKNRQAQNEQFEQIYALLNNEQQQAVNQLEGPVMVIAGPGTGKTQILGARIGKILQEADKRPENILCLTYTDAGVIAMRKRLIGFIGADAYKVNIYTFHAFCNDVIQENLSLFEKTALDPISELQRIELFTQLIDSFPKNHPLKRYRGDVYYEIGNLQHLFANMKKEGWTPDQLIDAIDKYLADIPTRDEFIYQKNGKGYQKGDPKLNKLAEEKEKMDKLRAAVNEFNPFQELMRKRNLYDFDDMINWVIKAFQEQPLLLSRYQEQFQYILVDEYQDTSGTQNKLVELLISYWDEPNIFVVGDDDQSIYRFQGANVSNMVDFANKYKQSIRTVVLTKNYRSVQPVLDIAKTLIDNNNERLVNAIDNLSKELTAANTNYANISITPVLQEYENPQQEMIGICEAVEDLLRKNISPGRIAIIYRENKYGEELAQYFKLKQIPVYSKRNLNLFNIPFAQQLILLLKYIAAEHDTPFGGDEMLFGILHFNWLGIAAIDIAKLSAERADRQFQANKCSLRELINEKTNAPTKDLFTNEIPGLRSTVLALEELIALEPNCTLQQLFEAIIRKTGVLKYIMQHPEKHWLLQVLDCLFDFIKVETQRNPSLDLQKLVGIIDLMKQEKIAIPIVQTSGNDKAINLLTAHGSKGLEFEYVFIAGCISANWEKKRKPAGGYTIPDTLFTTINTSTEQEELRRLFYVAITRAEKNLMISWYRSDKAGKAKEPTQFIAEIREEHLLPIEVIQLPTEIVSTYSALHFEEELAPEIEKMEAVFIDKILDKFVMNVTALNNYLKCPLQFYFNNLVRVPSGKSEASEFGSAVHHALDKFFKQMRVTNEFPDKPFMIKEFNWHIDRHRENFTKEQFKRRMEYGQEILSNYYDKYIGNWNKIVSIEQTIRGVTVDGIPIKGKLDKLEFDGKQVNVVDYKTGDPDKAKDKLKEPNDKEPNGGDYWRQAVFYKILVDHYEQKEWKAVSAEFDFIEPDKNKTYRKEKILITEASIQTVTEQIKTVWQKIQQRDFYTGCGKADCKWCGFVKTNELAVALHPIGEEEQGEDI